MNLFCPCINCKIPVIVTSLDPFCPFCKKPIKNIEDGHGDGFGFFIEEYKEKQYFEWEGYSETYLRGGLPYGDQ